MNYSNSVPIVVNSAGLILISQALTFGWERMGMSAEFRSHVQSVCLFVAGAGILALSVFVRQTVAKISDLEKQVFQLKWDRDQAKFNITAALPLAP